MKRRTKLGLALATSGLGIVVLSSCTTSFCSGIDTSRMKYAFEPGIMRIEEAGVNDAIVFHGETNDYTIKGAKLVTAQWVPEANDLHVGNFVYHHEDPEKKKELTFLNGIIKSARDSGVKTIDGSSVEYMRRFDFLALNTIFGKVADQSEHSLEYTYSEELGKATVERDLSYNSYLRFYSGGADALDNWNKFNGLYEISSS